MELNLKNKTVFITGASSGIGAAAAQLFSAKRGCDRLYAATLPAPSRPPRRCGLTGGTPGYAGWMSVIRPA